MGRSIQKNCIYLKHKTINHEKTTPFPGWPFCAVHLPTNNRPAVMPYVRFYVNLCYSHFN